MRACLVNPVVRAILRSRLHGLLSRSLMLMTYTGRVSDRTFTIPVMYARQNGHLLVYVGHHESKAWWRNLRGGAPVHVHFGREDFAGTARLVDGDAGVRADYVRRFPHARKALDRDFDPMFVEVTDIQPVQRPTDLATSPRRGISWDGTDERDARRRRSRRASGIFRAIGDPHSRIPDPRRVDRGAQI